MGQPFVLPQPNLFPEEVPYQFPGNGLLRHGGRSSLRAKAARAIQIQEKAGFNQPVTDQLLTISNKSIRGKISSGQFVIQEWNQRENLPESYVLVTEQVWGAHFNLASLC